MKIRISVQSKGDLSKELQKTLSLKGGFAGELATAGNVTIEKLRSVTPTRTGRTAGSWSQAVEQNQNGLELSISNDNLTKTGIPIVALLRYGHGTGTGGYVPPNDFVTPVVDDLVNDVSRLIDRKLR